MKKIAVAFSHYCLPEKRLAGNFKWNDAFYRNSVGVFVATDKQYPAPDYARCVICPPMKVFSLSLSSNLAVSAALATDADVIVKSDVDIAFQPEMWDSLETVRDGYGICPMFQFIQSYETRHKLIFESWGSLGVIAMTAHDWRLKQYDERISGWGWEDVCFFKDVESVGVKIDRVQKVWHIQHDSFDRTVINPMRMDENKVFVAEHEAMIRGEQKPT